MRKSASQMFVAGLLVATMATSACQVSDGGRHLDETAALDGVWRGVAEDVEARRLLRGHVLDGLMLAVDIDTHEAHSAELDLRDGHLSGLFAQRDSTGERERDYRIDGYGQAYEHLDASLIGSRSDGSLSLFYDQPRSFDHASFDAVAGQYSHYGVALDISLSIDRLGRIEAYDDAGCVYFGSLDIPDSRRNLYAVTLEVDNCAIARDFAFGIGSLDWDEQGWETLILPVWFDGQDRVEAWTLHRH